MVHIIIVISILNIDANIAPEFQIPRSGPTRLRTGAHLFLCLYNMSFNAPESRLLVSCSRSADRVTFFLDFVYVFCFCDRHAYVLEVYV